MDTHQVSWCYVEKLYNHVNTIWICILFIYKLLLYIHNEYNIIFLYIHNKYNIIYQCIIWPSFQWFLEDIICYKFQSMINDEIGSLEKNMDKEGLSQTKIQKLKK